MPSIKYSVLFKNKIRKFNKTTNVDPDKSISIRAIIISSISYGESKIFGILQISRISRNWKASAKIFNS